MNKLRVIAPFMSLILLFLGLEVLNHFQIVSDQLVPPPSLLYRTFIDSYLDFKNAFFESLNSSLRGFFLSAFLGILIALAFSLSKILKYSILPFAIFFQTVPIIAIAPLLVIYFGFGQPTVIASATIVSIFPIIANALLGLESIPPQQLDLFRLYKASSWQILWKLRWPNAYSSIYAGLKISCGLSVIGVVAGEFVAGGGLGSIIDSARTQQRLDLVYVSLALLSLLGLILVGSLRIFDYFMRKNFHFGLALKD